MKTFNQCHNYVTKIQGFTVPKNGFYGKDKIGYWVLTNTAKLEWWEPLEYYRNKPGTDEWYLIQDHSEYAEQIKKVMSKYNFWNTKVEYPRLTGLREFTGHDNPYITAPYNSVNKTFKIGRCPTDKRHEYKHMMKLDVAEWAMCGGHC